MKNYSPLPHLKCLTLTACLALNLIGCAQYTAPVAPEENVQALSLWQQGRDYQAAGRFELARQQYLLALAASRTSDAQVLLQRDLFVIDRMMQAMR